MTKSNTLQSDWLASDPIFYNEKTGKISRNVNEVIDYTHIEFHPEGLVNYLAWGYSVFGQTPIRNVKFLSPNQKITSNEGGELKLMDLPDPVINWSHKPTKPNDVVELIKTKVQSWEKSLKTQVVIPLSGGYDSRLLASLIKNKSNACAYTFGPTTKQDDSFEVKYASATARQLKIKWEQIRFGNYHEYTQGWYDLYGVSTHAHGMYQMDFYQQINQKHAQGAVLSGIIGDAWSGRVVIDKINSINDLSRLGYSHGVHADPTASILGQPTELKDIYFKQHRRELVQNEGQLIASMRMKMILLSYLFKVPASLGLQFYGPFLDPELVGAMLNLPSSERENRLWQTQYFRDNGLLWEENYQHPVNKTNTINQDLINLYPLEPLNVQILAKTIRPDYINWVNSNLSPNLLSKLATFSLNTRYIGYIANRLRIPNIQMNAYSAYLTLKPLELILLKSEGI